jgi:hypothetical protein
MWLDDYEQYFDSGPITALDIDNAAPDWKVVITSLLIADC